MPFFFWGGAGECLRNLQGIFPDYLLFNGKNNHPPLLYASAVLVIGIHILVMPLATVNFLYPLSSNTNLLTQVNGH